LELKDELHLPFSFRKCLFIDPFRWQPFQPQSSLLGGVFSPNYSFFLPNRQIQKVRFEESCLVLTLAFHLSSTCISTWHRRLEEIQRLVCFLQVDLLLFHSGFLLFRFSLEWLLLNNGTQAWRHLRLYLHTIFLTSSQNIFPLSLSIPHFLIRQLLDL
jgi:hypothetical protein